MRGQIAEPQILTPAVEYFGLLPLLFLVGGALVLLFTPLFRGRLPQGTSLMVTLLAGGGSFVSAMFVWHDLHADDGRPARSLLSGAVGIDGFTVFFFLLIAAAVVMAALAAEGYLRRERLMAPEFYVLLLLSGAGGMVMAMANDLIVLFVGLETLSIAAYVLAGFHVRRMSSQEAAMKYFVLGAFSSGFFLYGIALVYGATGSTNLSKIRDFLDVNAPALTERGLGLGQIPSEGVLVAGFALLLVGFGFKIAASPFHTWAPDVYQGSPTPVVGYMASAVKAAAFAALIRVFTVTFLPFAGRWDDIVFALAIVTLLTGSFLAIVQTDIKRVLAYSSINHAGFILIGVAASGVGGDVAAQGVEAALFYLLAYTFMVLGSFTIVAVVSGDGDTATGLDDIRGLARRRPTLAFVFAVLLFAQAGVPLTSGFFAKFEVLSAAVDGELYALAIVGMLSAVVAAYLYIRITVSMFFSDATGDEETEAAAPAVSAGSGTAASGDRRSYRLGVPLGAALTISIAFWFTVIVGFLPDRAVDFAADALPVVFTTTN